MNNRENINNNTQNGNFSFCNYNDTNKNTPNESKPMQNQNFRCSTSNSIIGNYIQVNPSKSISNNIPNNIQNLVENKAKTSNLTKNTFKSSTTLGTNQCFQNNEISLARNISQEEKNKINEKFNQLGSNFTNIFKMKNNQPKR